MAGTPKRASPTAALQQRNRELSILNEIAQALNREVDLERALQATLAHVARLLDLQTGWVWLLREESGESYLAAAQNLPPALASARHRMAGSCYCLDTYRKGDLAGAANVNVVACSRLESLVDGTNGLAYHASVPLYAQGKKVGLLNVAGPDWRQLSPEELRLLYTVGDLLSIAVERARLFARSTRLGAVDERNRLAREIHDTLAQGLSATALQLETADALLAAQAPPAQIGPVIQQALALTRTNLEEARRSVLDLRSAPLQGRTLAEALAALAANTSSAEGPLRVKLFTKGKSRPLPVRKETGLYRVAQEALTNVTRHANADLATVQLVLLPDKVCLRVTDNGRGFDPAAIADGCFGLVGMNERVKLLGGHLTIQSSPGTGTHLEAVIPL
ncbi:MAG TPA: GAF domain-containing sensor histidine kinase [Chloroflexia bacterium]|nr:GAF domain-containing sensor histidine kinase [Chloroflexia bacterium]